MLDSGSTISLLSENVFKKMPLRSSVQAKQSLMTASGNLMDVIAETELKISIGDLQSSQQFIVVSSLITYCILGIDFLARHKVQLNSAKRIIIGPGIGELNVADMSRGSSNSSCPVHRENIPEIYSISTIVDSSIEDDWDCRCAVPRNGIISTFELPVCNEEFIDIMEEFRDLFNSVSGVAQCRRISDLCLS